MCVDYTIRLSIIIGQWFSFFPSTPTHISYSPSTWANDRSIYLVPRPQSCTITLPIISYQLIAHRTIGDNQRRVPSRQTNFKAFLHRRSTPLLRLLRVIGSCQLVCSKLTYQTKRELSRNVSTDNDNPFPCHTSLAPLRHAHLFHVVVAMWVGW